MRYFALVISLIFSSNAFANWTVGRTLDSAKPSIQTVCPDVLFLHREVKEMEEDMPPLRKRMWTKKEFDYAYDQLAKCINPQTGSGIVSVWDTNSPNAEYPSILSTITNSNWYCHSGNPARPMDPGLKPGDFENLVFKVYQCHKNAGWPTATDYVTPNARKAPNPAQEAPAPQSLAGGNTPAVASSPEEALRNCQNEAYVSGVKGDARKAFMTDCIKIAMRSVRKADGSTNLAAGPSSKSDGNSSIQDWPSSQPNTAPFINPKCVDFKQTGKGISDMYKTVYNKCSTPVEVLFCFEDRKNPGRDCKDHNVGWGTTEIIKPGRSAQVSDVPTSWTVHYMVCDMSNPKLLCVYPK